MCVVFCFGKHFLNLCDHCKAAHNHDDDTLQYYYYNGGYVPSFWIAVGRHGCCCWLRVTTRVYQYHNPPSLPLCPSNWYWCCYWIRLSPRFGPNPRRRRSFTVVRLLDRPTDRPAVRCLCRFGRKKILKDQNINTYFDFATILNIKNKENNMKYKNIKGFWAASQNERDKKEIKK